MIRSLTGKSVDIAIRRGQFIIRPLKNAYKTHRTILSELTYNTWACGNEKQCFVKGFNRQGPLVSIVVPAYNPIDSDFLEMVYSVINQHYENWELIIVNASTARTSRDLINKTSEIDRRIKSIVVRQNQGISGNTNLGLNEAKGEFIAFLDHDDLLHPCALHTAVNVLQEEAAGLVYTDEDKVSADGSLYFGPFCKPQWSPDLLANANYINHLTVMKTDYVKKLGGLRSGSDGAQDYDLLFRVVDEFQPKIVQIPRILYHWRAAPSSTASNIGTKEYVLKAGTKALQDHLDRTKIKGKAKALVDRPGWYETEFKLPTHLSIVIGPVDQANYRLCNQWLKKLLPKMKNIPKLQLIVGDWFKEFGKPTAGLEIAYIDEKEYWQQAAEAINGEVAICFNIATLPYAKKSIDKVVGRAFQQRVIVAPIIMSEGGNIIDAGLVEAEHGLEPLFTDSHLTDESLIGNTEWVRNVTSLSLGVYAGNQLLIKEFLSTIALSKPLGSKDLTRFVASHQDVAVVMDGLAPHSYKGELNTQKPINQTYFNPELNHPSTAAMNIKYSAWGKMGELSERDES